MNLESNQQTPAYADAYNRIGDCLFHNRQFAMAEENYTRAAQFASRPPEIIRCIRRASCWDCRKIIRKDQRDGSLDP